MFFLALIVLITFNSQSIIQDLEDHKPVNDMLVKALKDLRKDEYRPEGEQLQQELTDLTTRFARLVKISNDRKTEIDAIEPLVKEHDEASSKVQHCNEEVEKVLFGRQKLTDLQSLEIELEQSKVSHIFLADFH